MDRRSWLFRKKSSDKSPAQTESSDSLSSQSERFSDEQQAYANNNTQSPEVTSKIASSDEELNHSLELADKLSSALSDISAKEDLVKQHAKVAEDAVSGWENAENEALSLKQQLDAVTQKNLALESRVSHLDGALKECVRQLRQSREEHEQKIHDIMFTEKCEQESTKSVFEARIAELQTQLEISKTQAASAGLDLHPKLEASEKEISDLRFKVLYLSEELQLRTIERDLSIQAAETASKQHLESIKKVAKLEADLRRVKPLMRNISPHNDHKSCAASSSYVESFTDSQSDCETRFSDSWASALIAELDHFTNDKALVKNFVAPSLEMNLMDDFLEMEELAETQTGKCCIASEALLSSQPNNNSSAQLEGKLKDMEEDKAKLELALFECKEQLKSSVESLDEAGIRLVDLETQLMMADELKSGVMRELEVVHAEKESVESKLLDLELDNKSLASKVSALEEYVVREKTLSVESVNRCLNMEDGVSVIKFQNGAMKIKQEKELTIAATKVAACQNTIASLGRQLKNLSSEECFLMECRATNGPVTEIKIYVVEARQEKINEKNFMWLYPRA